MDALKKHVISKGSWILFFVLITAYLQSFLSYNFFYQEQFSLFRFSQEYFIDSWSHIGGGAAYLAAFAIQFFKIPYVGPLLVGLLVTAMSVLLYGMWKRSASELPFPLLYLLPGICSVWACVDFNYHLDGLLSLLIGVACLNGYVRINSFVWRCAYGAVMAWAGYYVAGPHLLWMVPAVVLLEIFYWRNRFKWWSLLLLPWGFSLPFILYETGIGGEWRLLVSPDAYYHALLPSQKVNYLPAIFVILNVLAICLLHKNRKVLSGWKRWTFAGVQLLVLACIFHQGVSHYNAPKNYEIKVLDYYSRTGQWQQILDYPDLRAGQNALHACYQNLALSHLGKLGDELFRYPQCGRLGIVVSWNKSVNASMLLSDVYYQMGNIALAQEMAFEGMIASEHAVNPRLLLRLVQTNLIYGNYRVAEKYISLLEETWGYAEAAGSYRRFLDHPERVAQDPDLGSRQACIAHTSGLTNPQKAALDQFQIVCSNPDYQPAFQYYGAICLLCKDLKAFEELVVFKKQEAAVFSLPRAFQEAWVLLHADEPDLWASYGVTEEVAERFKEYGRLVATYQKEPNLAYRLQNSYQDTFWFYYMFTK